MSLYLGNQIIAGYTEDKTYHYNVGDIFYTSRLDTSLNGAVECNGGTYSTADYTGDGNIGNLLENGKLPYVSLTEYNNIVSSKGSCRAFGWDGTGTTTFKVPKLADVYIEAGIASTAGEFIDESLPNITGGVGGMGNRAFYSGESVYGAFNIKNPNNANLIQQVGETLSGYQTYFNTSFNASRSSSVYKDNAHVHPNSVRYRAMIQLFNSATDEAVAICGDVVAEVAQNTIGIRTKVSKAGDTMTGALIVPTIHLGDSTNAMGYIEVFGGGTTWGGYIDFHNGNSTADYTSRIVEDENGKLDLVCPNGLKINGGISPYLKITYVNGTSGYRIWSDGYCEQWGYTSVTAATNNVNVSFLKTFSSMPNILTTIRSNTAYVSSSATPDVNATVERSATICSASTTGFKFCRLNADSNIGKGGACWRACGYLASGQY